MTREREDQVPQILERLAALARGAAPPTLFQVRASTAYRLNAVACDGPLLVLPLAGIKRAILADERWQAAPGDILAVHWPTRLDIENCPPHPSGDYLAAVIVFPPEVLAAARSLCLPAPPCPEGGGAVSVLPATAVAGALARWLAAGSAASAVRQRLAAVDLLLALAEAGHGGFLNPPPDSLAERITRLVAAEPARLWDSAQLESALGISGATLRRHLAAGATSLRIVLREARLRHALGLLQSTRLPVKAVAARCGYSSVSTFARRFAERYGIAPSRVANA